MVGVRQGKNKKIHHFIAHILNLQVVESILMVGLVATPQFLLPLIFSYALVMRKE